MENIDKLILQLQNEQRTAQKDFYRFENLERLKEVAALYQGEDKLVSFKEIAEKIKNQEPELKIMTGWNDFDAILDGFRLKQLVVVSALTKSGKTSWLMDLTTKIKEHNPVWFPFEEGAEELIQKFLERGEEPPHGFTPSVIKKITLEWIEGKIVEGIAKFNTRIIFIDQLDFIVPLTSQNRSDQIGQAMRDLKGLAKKWGVVIFLICHLIKTKMDTQPTLEDLKGSSSIGQEADTVILIWREMKREKGKVVIGDKLNISIQANRRTGKTGNIGMVYKNGHFIQEEWKSDYDATAEEAENLSDSIQ